MALSLTLVIFLGLLADHLLKKIHIPGLVGMLAVGVILGPYGLNYLSDSLLAVSYDMRMIALIVILLRAGLKIKRQTLNSVGKTALTMSIIPSTLEGLAITLAAPYLLGMSYLESAILGFIVAAVSPSVLVPSMLKAMERNRGTDKGIPTMVLASSSLGNTYVIVVFSTLVGMYGGAADISVPMRLLEIPASIITGVLAGGIAGLIMHKVFISLETRATKMTITVIGAGVLLITMEGALKGIVPISGLLAVMAIGLVILEKSEQSAHSIANKLGKIWIPAEILLFTLVGAQVNISVALEAGLIGAAIIAIGLTARSIGTYISVYKSGLNGKEKLFCVISGTPKATVQAAIGAIPLSLGVKGGEVILAVAVLSIILTAPLGAIGIDISIKRLLNKS